MFSWMVESKNCRPIQLIDTDGEFNVEGLKNFVKKTKLSDCGRSYVVVAIMGPQSSVAIDLEGSDGKERGEVR
ncbi:unnamed protein product [Cochlearia groenlandica]